MILHKTWFHFGYTTIFAQIDASRDMSQFVVTWRKFASVSQLLWRRLIIYFLWFLNSFSCMSYLLFTIAKSNDELRVMSMTRFHWRSWKIRCRFRFPSLTVSDLAKRPFSLYMHWWNIVHSSTTDDSENLSLSREKSRYSEFLRQQNLAIIWSIRLNFGGWLLDNHTFQAYNCSIATLVCSVSKGLIILFIISLNVMFWFSSVKSTDSVKLS